MIIFSLKSINTDLAKDMASEIVPLKAENAAQASDFKNAGETLRAAQNALSEAQEANNRLKIESARLDERFFRLKTE